MKATVIDVAKKLVDARVMDHDALLRLFPAEKKLSPLGALSVLRAAVVAKKPWSCGSWIWGTSIVKEIDAIDRVLRRAATVASDKVIEKDNELWRGYYTLAANIITRLLLYAIPIIILLVTPKKERKKKFLRFVNKVAKSTWFAVLTTLLLEVASNVSRYGLNIGFSYIAILSHQPKRMNEHCKYLKDVNADGDDSKLVKLIADLESACKL